MKWCKDNDSGDPDYIMSPEAYASLKRSAETPLVERTRKFFAAGTTKDDVKHALTMSFVRQRLHDEGKYTPTAYAFIWPRNTFLDWADKPDVRALIKSENDKSDNARAASYTEKGRRVASKIAAI